MLNSLFSLLLMFPAFSFSPSREPTFSPGFSGLGSASLEMNGSFWSELTKVVNL